MRQGVPVTYLHGDHLGSASLQTNDTVGGLVAAQRYTPFGDTYYMTGTLTTDKQFTGQRLESGFGVYDFGARFYSPIFARFISADSLVPRPGDPQSLNRYSYVSNSPLVRIDPTGHCDTNGDDWCHETREDSAGQVSSYATSLRDQVAKGNNPGGLKPVEALARIADMAWLLAGSVADFMWIMTSVIVGVDPSGQKPLSELYQNGDYGGDYWVGWDLLPFGEGSSSHYSQTGDWNSAYVDGTANQGFHFWGLAALTYFEGSVVASLGNNYHDPVLVDSAFKLLTGKSYYEIAKTIPFHELFGIGQVI